MPKIVIREYDKTKSVGPEYASFAVVVPGVVGSDSNRAVFEENEGIYECHSRDDFIKNVKINPNAEVLVEEATGPVIDPEFGESPKALTETEFDTLVAKGNLYVATLKGSEPVGKFKDDTYRYDPATADEKLTYIFKAPTSTPEVGGETATTSETGSETLFAVLKYIGNDDETKPHYGNQIAYELLGLGYTVYYKEIKRIDDLTNPNWWKPLKDKSKYRFRYIISGLLGTSAAINQQMLAVAKFDPENKAFDTVEPLSAGRGDCIALLDIDPKIYETKHTQEEIIESVYNSFENIPTSKYAAAFMPTVTYTKASMDSKYTNRTFPASFHYLACAARSSERFSEWYANAGYTRGISNYTIESTGCNLGEAAINAFQRRFIVGKATLAINPIIKLRGSYYLWGNRTTYALGAKDTEDGDLKASHFLNIRQLCCTIKQQVYETCKQFTFDPNSATLWTNFCNTIRPTLEKMKADQGISDYKIIKVKSDRKAFLSAIIRIVPIEAVEDFDISVYLEDSIAGTIANTEESE